FRVPCVFLSSRRRHTSFSRDWSSDVCSSDLDDDLRSPSRSRRSSSRSSAFHGFASRSRSLAPSRDRGRSASSSSAARRIMVEVYVGAGSNIEPARHLKLAAAALAERFPGLRCSDVYRSPAFGFSGAPFLNMVFAFEFTGSPDDVERELHDIEYEGGRVRRGERFSSRTLDLDL